MSQLPMTEFWINKAYRAASYFAYRFGWRQQDCTACNGSGRYDSHRSPRCGACNGTGKEEYPGPKATNNAMVDHAPRLAALYERIIAERENRKSR